MLKEIITNPVKLSAKASTKNSDKNQEKRNPDPDDYNEEKGPPIKEMPEKDSRNREENNRA